MESIRFDDILQEIGKLGRYQVFMLILTGLGAALVSAHCLANVFLVGTPRYLCQDYVWFNQTNASSCGVVDGSEQWCAEPCKMASYQGGMNVSQDQEVSCQNWMYDRSVYGLSAVSQWDLVCSSGWKVALAQSTFMLGFTVAAVVLGNLSDIFGRKKVWLVSMAMVFFTGTSAAFMPTYWTFIATRAASGLFVAGVLNSGFVLLMEVTGSNGRILFGSLFNCCFPVGYMIISGVAYLIKDYRYIQLFCGMAAILFLPYFWVLDESPRWLLSNKRNEEAIDVIKKVAKTNKKIFPKELLTLDQSNLIKTVEVKHKQDKGQRYSLLTVLKYPTMRWRMLNVCFNWFVNSFVYYGISLGCADLMGGPHLNLFLSGLMEFPSVISSIFLMKKIGRRLTLAMFLLTASACCFPMAFIPKDHGMTKVVLSLCGKLCISASFNTTYIYAAEIFPTVVRNLVVGCSSTSSRIGSTMAPFILITGQFWSPMPMVCFGGFSLAAGILSLLLPETLNQKLPDTLNEGERFGKDSTKLFAICQKRKEDIVTEN